MADDLAELRARIQFARSEIDTLATAVTTFVSLTISNRKREQDWATWALLATATTPVSTAIRSRAGMIANELRSVLDGLASALADRHTGNSDGVYFPISKSATVFHEDGMRKIKKLSPTDQAIIVSLAPYREASPTLFGLHEADRTRKHTRLAASIADVSGAGVHGACYLGPGSQMIDCYVDDVPVRHLIIAPRDALAVVGREVTIVSGIPKALGINVVYGVAYSDPADLTGLPLVETLSGFANTVAEIVGRF